MEPVFVTGHRNPDTDSIVAAMSYAALQKALGNREYMAARLGPLNDETQIALKKFDFAEPIQISNLRTQVRDLDYDTPPVLNQALTINSAWQSFTDTPNLATLPVTDAEGHLTGTISRGNIAAYQMKVLGKSVIEPVPFFNVLTALEGNLVSGQIEDIDKLEGEVVIGIKKTGISSYGFKEHCVAFIGASENAFKAACEKKASCIILCQAEYTAEMRKLSPKCPVLYTPLDAYQAIRMLNMSVPISKIMNTDLNLSFQLDDYLDDVRTATMDKRTDAFPIVDKHGQVVGSLSRFHLLNPRKKKVVLVDHNELAQSVPGLEQAEIVAVIDHHRLADVQTLNPVYVRNEPVGSTNTIIGSMFQEKGLVPSKKLAGLMATAIVSDTVMFKSPTCTPLDVAMAQRLARIGEVDLEEIAGLIFNRNSSDEKSPRDLIFADYKDFHIAGYSLGIGQVTCADSSRVLKRKKELLSEMDAYKRQKNLDLMLLMITDVLLEGTALLYIGEDDIIAQAFGVKPRLNECFLQGVVSRKKQVVPALSLLWG